MGVLRKWPAHAHRDGPYRRWPPRSKAHLPARWNDRSRRGQSGRRRCLAMIHMIRRVVAGVSIVALTMSVSPVGHTQEGVISGRATGAAQRPYTDYNVQLV